MELIQGRIVTGDVRRLAAFYARLAHASAVLNDYYVEVPTRAMSVGFSRRRFTEYREDQATRPRRPQPRAEIILDIQAADIDAKYQRIAGFLNLRVRDIAQAYRDWSARGAAFLTEPRDHGYEIRAYRRDPDGHLIEVGQTT